MIDILERPVGSPPSSVITAIGNVVHDKCQCPDKQDMSRCGVYVHKNEDTENPNCSMCFYEKEAGCPDCGK